jgi:hypothetical protein
MISFLLELSPVCLVWRMIRQVSTVSDKTGQVAKQMTAMSDPI